MQRSDGASHAYKGSRNNLNQSESFRKGSRSNLNHSESFKSDRSERKVSFSRSVGVQHIPRSKERLSGRLHSKTSRPKPRNDLYTKVVLEPVSRDSERLIQEANDLIKVVDTVNCTTPQEYYSLDRSRKGRSAPRGSRPHHDYANVIVSTSGRTDGSRGSINNLTQNSSGPNWHTTTTTLNNKYDHPDSRNRGSTNNLTIPVSLNSGSYNSSPNWHGTTTTTLNNRYDPPTNYNPSVRTTTNQIQTPKTTNINRLRKPLRSNSNSNPSLAVKHDQDDYLYKSVPDLRTTTYLDQRKAPNLERYDYSSEDPIDRDPGYRYSSYDHYDYEDDPGYEQEHGKYHYEQQYDPPEQYDYKMAYHANDHPRKVERIIQKFNQETTFFGTTPTVEPNDYNNHNNNQPFSYTRGRSPTRNDQKRFSDDYTHRKLHYDQDRNDYSAKIIITNDYDDDHAYESYQIPDDLGKTTTYDYNINMSSVGVQTDVGASRGRSRAMTRPAERPRGRSQEWSYKPRNDQRRDDHTTLTSATLVRQMNHNFGRCDRSPSPPTRVATKPRPKTEVVPLLSDLSDDQERPDPLARIRSQVRARERQQENSPPRDRQSERPQMTPLTIDEVDALSLVVDDKSLVVDPGRNQVERRSKLETNAYLTHEVTTTRTTRTTKSEERQKRVQEREREKTPRLEERERERTPRLEDRERSRSRDRERDRKATKSPVVPKEKDEEKKDKKKKKKIKIKFFYDKPDDHEEDRLEKFEEFKGKDYNYEEEEKKNYLSLERKEKKKEEKQQRGSTPTNYSTSSLGRPRGREKIRSNNNNNNNNNNTTFSTLQHSRGRSRRSSGSVSSSPTPRPAKPKQPVRKPRYFGDTDIEDHPKPSTTTTATTTRLPQGPGDYRSLPSRVEAKNRVVRRRSPNSSHNSSESEVDSHASKASRVSTGSNRSVYLHATAVADIPVRNSSNSTRQSDRQSDRQTDRQTRKVTRSFSLLSPWKPRHYRERYEIDYDRKKELPPRPPRRPQQQQQQEAPQKGSKLSTWLRRKKNKEAKGI